MKNLALLLLLSVSYSFGQYIEQGTIKLENLEEPIEAKDIVYLNDKNIQFRNVNYPYVLSNVKTKNIESLEFDSVNYHNEVPKLSETFYEKREGRGVYMTMEDVLNNNLTDQKIKTKQLTQAGYEFESDLLDVVDLKGKKLKDATGILHNGDVYLNVKYISNNEAKDQKGSFVLNHPANTFVRIKYMDENIIYLEMPLQTVGNFLLTSTVLGGGIVGGALAGIISTSTPSNYRPIIKFHDEDSFYTIKNCEIFNEHFAGRNSGIHIDCENDYNLNNIRKEIFTKL